MTAGFWRDPARYEETYWSRWKDVWVHGDWATIDEDGFWYIRDARMTRSRSGQAAGSGGGESVLVAIPPSRSPASSAPRTRSRARAIVCFVCSPGPRARESLRRELAERVAASGQGAQSPEKVLFTRDLPDAQREDHARVIRATYLGKEPGDLSALENRQR